MLVNLLCSHGPILTTVDKSGVSSNEPDFFMAIILANLHILQLSLWLRDVVDDLCQHKLRDITDFEWQRYLRPYVVMDTSPPPTEEESGARGDLVMRCLDQGLRYGYEYTGCHGLPAISPHTDNYIIALTQVSAMNELSSYYITMVILPQALSSHLSSHLIGSIGSGKVQTIKVRCSEIFVCLKSY